MNAEQPRTARRRRGGFTMVEIIVVVIIIAVLATMVAPQFFARVGQAKQSVAKQKLVELEKAVDMFSYDYSRLPEDLNEIVERPDDIDPEDWNPPVIKAKDLLDPWNRPFVYKHPGDHGSYDLYTLGADGEIGGEKDNADVVNW